MNNIRFNYLYRDGSNYKSWGEVVFSNPENRDLSEVETKLINAFLQNKQFIADQVSVPEKFLFINGGFTRDDHCYHEFDSIEICEVDVTDALGRSIADFLRDVEIACKQGWKVFDVLDRA